jgi:tRNA (guanine-N7-)-methyltransferase
LEPLDLSSIFPEYAGKLDLEIGFGRGRFMRLYAGQHPQRHIVGVEVRKQIVDVLQQRVLDLGLKNVHLIHSQGQIVLEDVIPDRSLERVFIFHPDPWMKKRHHKRRIVNNHLLAALSKKMAPDGRVYISTDVPQLWESMTEAFAEHRDFVPCEDTAFWQQYYDTHWDLFCRRVNRPSDMGCYRYCHGSS